MKKQLEITLRIVIILLVILLIYLELVSDAKCWVS
ncbi:hypothetical protein HDE69_002886 [Pedobacter cryoconitis]|uniref:Uncharacterized protein n=1 Tax=Pedobacter cryoconitis TaxID=188932 RepID=A0A7W8YUH4_9SPHI|nr:hypothetical protein [Pedobacter cryoconitis]MBB5644052.1 hypothetical protein [Pedobacter cryoconitis]